MPSVRWRQISCERLCSGETALLQQHLRWSAKIGNQSSTDGLQCSSKTNCWCITILAHYTTTGCDVPSGTIHRCMTVFKALHGMTHKYLTELCTPVAVGEKRAALISASTLHGLMNIPYTTFGDRVFRVAGLAAWSSLPINIRTTLKIESFKRHIKTHLFAISYS